MIREYKRAKSIFSGISWLWLLVLLSAGLMFSPLPVKAGTIPPNCDAGADKCVIVGETVEFNGSCVSPGGVEIVSFDWNFGDGTTTSIGPVVDHVYVDEGVFEASFSCTDANGNVCINSLFVDVLADADPSADVMANGSDGPVIIKQGDNLKVTVSLNPGCSAGVAADWWALAITPFGLFWLNFTPPLKWVASGVPISIFGLPLFSVPPFTILQISALPVGAYTFFFGVDLIPNGTLDFAPLFVDSVGVTIQSP